MLLPRRVSSGRINSAIAFPTRACPSHPQCMPSGLPWPPRTCAPPRRYVQQGRPSAAQVTRPRPCGPDRLHISVRHRPHDEPTHHGQRGRNARNADTARSGIPKSRRHAGGRPATRPTAQAERRMRHRAARRSNRVSGSAVPCVNRWAAVTAPCPCSRPTPRCRRASSAHTGDRRSRPPRVKPSTRSGLVGDATEDRAATFDHNRSSSAGYPLSGPWKLSESPNTNSRGGVSPPDDPALLARSRHTVL